MKAPLQKKCTSSLSTLFLLPFLQKTATASEAIAVGPPVTRRPPHGSRRAVFPHRALQSSSLPHASSGQRSCLAPLWIPHNPWPRYLEVLQESREALPVVAGPLTPPIQPLQEYTYYAIEELLETRAVPVHSVVAVIPPEFAVYLREQLAESPMAILSTPLGEALQGRPQFRARRAPLQMRLPRAIPPPVQLKPQELKASLAGRLVAAEGKDAGLLGCQSQPEFLQAWPQGRVEPLRLCLVLKRADVIIRISEEDTLPLDTGA